MKLECLVRLRLFLLGILLVFTHFGVAVTLPSPIPTEEKVYLFPNNAKIVYKPIVDSADFLEVLFYRTSDTNPIPIYNGKLNIAGVTVGKSTKMKDGFVQWIKKESMPAVLIQTPDDTFIIDQDGRYIKMNTSYFPTQIDSFVSSDNFTAENLPSQTYRSLTASRSKFLGLTNDARTIIWGLESGDIYHHDSAYWSKGKLVKGWEGSINAKSGIVSSSFQYLGDSFKPKKLNFSAQSISLPLQKNAVGSDSSYEDIFIKVSEDIIDQPKAIHRLIDLKKDMDRKLTPKRHRVILLDGTTGAGKTALGKSFAKHAYSSETAFHELDCNKYGGTHKDSMSWELFGSGPGYLGSNETTALVEFFRKNAQNGGVIVLNEMDKASPVFWEIMMEILDSGIVRPTKGEPIVLNNFTFILTSNRNAEKIYPKTLGRPLTSKELQIRIDSLDDDTIKDSYTKSSNPYDKSKNVPIEVLQRVDAVVAMGPPSYEGAQKIVEKHINELAKHFFDSTKIQYTFDASVYKRIVDSGYEPNLGIRKLHRHIEYVFTQIFESTGKDVKPGVLNVTFTENNDKFTGKFLVSQKTVEGEAPTVPLSVAAPKLGRSSIHPIFDPNKREILRTLEVSLSKIVMGQPEAVSLVTRALRSRAINPKLKQPARLLFLGPSGTGKTELGRAVAEVFFENPNMFGRFPIGDVVTMGDLNNIFGSPRGHSGSDSYGMFEQFLVDNPDGGVGIMDEIGNPTDPNVRDAIRKKFYEILDEGFWTSPSGKKYDVTKYLFLFTSNEGQEIFQKLPNDDLRLATHERLRNPDTLSQFMRESHGWPEALMNRFGPYVTMARPLVESIRSGIAAKLVNRSVEELKDIYGFKLKFEPDFYKKVGNIFYSPSAGARKMRDMADSAIAELIGQHLLHEGTSVESLPKSTLTIGIQDNFEYIKKYRNSEPVREVKLTLKVSTPGKKARYYDFKEVTRDAAKKSLLNESDFRRVAVHEAGHALANNPVLTGQTVEVITIQGAGNFGGYVRFSESKNMAGTRSSAIAELTTMLAGGVAESLMGFERSEGWRSDIDSARKRALQMVEHGLVRDPMSLPLQKDGKVALEHPMVQKVVTEMLNEAEKAAEAVLTKNFRALYLLSHHLRQKVTITGKEFNAIKNSQYSNENNKTLKRVLKGTQFQQSLPSPISCQAFYL